MTLKLRFAILFTFYVAIILIGSSITIYILNYNYRESDFFERVKIEGLEFHNTIAHVSNPQQATSAILTNVLHNSTLYDERIVIADTNRNILMLTSACLPCRRSRQKKNIAGIQKINTKT